MSDSYKTISVMVEWAQERIRSHPDDKSTTNFLEKIEKLIQRGEAIDALSEEERNRHRQELEELEARHEQERFAEYDRDDLHDSEFDFPVQDLYEKQNREYLELMEPWEHISKGTDGTYLVDEELLEALNEEFESIQSFGSTA